MAGATGGVQTVSFGVPDVRLDSCIHVVALRTATYFVYVFGNFPHPLPVLPPILVESVPDYDTRRPLRPRRVENVHGHRVRNQFVFLAQ